jgi:hypothetical protein
MSANPVARLTPVVTEYVVAGASFLIAGVLLCAGTAGSGAAYLLTGRWLARWERKHDARVLGGSLWRPWDIYVVPR